MDVRMFKGATLALITLVSMTSYATTKKMTTLEAKASCLTLFDQFQKATVEDQGDMAQELNNLLQEKGEICSAAISAVQQQLRRLGREHFIFGITLAINIDVNTPILYRFFSGGVSFNKGGSFFVAESAAGSSMRFTPYTGGSLGIRASKKSHGIVGVGLNVIIYIGGKNIKNVQDFNGVYLGGSVEFPSPIRTPFLSTSTGGAGYYTNTSSDATAVLLAWTKVSGEEIGSLIGRAISVVNTAPNGRGATFNDALKTGGEQYINLFEAIYGSLINLPENAYDKIKKQF